MAADSVRVYPPIYRLGKVGIWIRKALMAGILKGTPVLLQIQSFRRPPLTKFLQLIALMGEEEFYTLMLPFITWICHYQLGILLSVLMAIGFYTSGSLKNLLCLPRPPSPPVRPADKCNDWALPSHHAILNVTVPWYVWTFIYTHLEWSDPSSIVAFVGVSFWCFSVLFSRLYLGVHSPADVLIGGILGCLCLITYLLLEDVTRGLLFYGSTRFTLLYVVISLVLLSIHPDPKPKTFIVIETANMVSAACGFVIGAWINHVFAVNVTLEGFGLDNCLWQLLRFVIGMTVLLLAKYLINEFLKFTVLTTLSCFGLSCVYAKRKTEVTSNIVHYSPKTFIVLNKVSTM